MRLYESDVDNDPLIQDEVDENKEDTSGCNSRYLLHVY